MPTYDELVALALKSEGSYNISQEDLISFVKAGAIRAYKAGAPERENETVEADFNVETKKLRLSSRKSGESTAHEITDEATYKAIEVALSAMQAEIENSWNQANASLVESKFQELKWHCLPAEIVQGDSIGEIPVLINSLQAVLPAGEQITGESLKTGSIVQVYVKDLEKNSDTAQIVVSRTEPALVEHAMRLHIPEVDTGNIEIKAISRIPGGSSRVAVFSDLNAVERCEKRMQKVKDELGGEEIQFVEWYEDIKAFIVSCLMIEARDVLLIEGEKQALVEVFKDAAEKTPNLQDTTKKHSEKLTGYKIDIKLVQRDSSSDLPGV